MLGTASGTFACAFSRMPVGGLQLSPNSSLVYRLFGNAVHKSTLRPTVSLPSTLQRSFSYLRIPSSTPTGPLQSLSLQSQLHTRPSFSKEHPFGGCRSRFPNEFFLKRHYATHSQLYRPLPAPQSSGQSLLKPAIFTIGITLAAFYIAPSLNPTLKSIRIDPLSNSQTIVAAILVSNVAVFLGWRVPSLRRLFSRFMIMDPIRPSLSSMILSAFSHQSFAHLAFNMLALYSFATPLVSLLSPGYFIAFYLSAGCISSLGSLTYSTIMRGSRALLPSLGASGALYGLLGLCAALFPDNQVVLIFLPFLPIKIGYGVPGIMAVDALGLVRGWRTFDHAAHLAGGVTGYAFYYTWLKPKINNARHSIQYRSR